MTFKIDHTPFDESRELDCIEARRQRLAMPFDTHELDKLPQPTDDDPPYRPWWVVDRA